MTRSTTLITLGVAGLLLIIIVWWLWGRADAPPPPPAPTESPVQEQEDPITEPEPVPEPPPEPPAPDPISEDPQDADESPGDEQLAEPALPPGPAPSMEIPDSSPSPEELAAQRAAAVALWEEATGVSWERVQQYADNPSVFRYEFGDEFLPRFASIVMGGMSDIRFLQIHRSASDQQEHVLHSVFPIVDRYRLEATGTTGMNRQIYDIRSDGMELVIDHGFPQASWSLPSDAPVQTLLLMDALSLIHWRHHHQINLLAGTYFGHYPDILSNPWVSHLQQNPPVALGVPGIGDEERVLYSLDGLWDVAIVERRGALYKRIRMQRDMLSCQVDTMTRAEAPADFRVPTELAPWSGGDEWRDVLLSHHLVPDLAWHSATSGRAIGRHALNIFAKRDRSYGLTVLGSLEEIQAVKIFNVGSIVDDFADFAYDVKGYITISGHPAWPASTFAWSPNGLTVRTELTGQCPEEEDPTPVPVVGTITINPVLLEGSLRFRFSMEFLPETDPDAEPGTLGPELLLIPVPRKETGQPAMR